MKRSKLFLGFTAGLLAVVAFASAKVTSSLNIAYKNSSGTCVADATGSVQTIPNGNQLTTVKAGHTYLVFTYVHSACGKAAYAE
jgi:hypothetical protein